MSHIVATRNYYVIFTTLMVLTAITVRVAFVDLDAFGRVFRLPLNTIIALTIAVIKATLVVLYFMHLRYSTRLTWVVAASGVFWLGILFALAMSDYMSREWLCP